MHGFDRTVFATMSGVLLVAGTPAARAEAEVPSAVQAQAAPTLTAVSSRQSVNLFAPTEAIKLTFTAAGLTPGGKLALQLRFTDEFDKVRATREMAIEADAAGKWSGEVEAPNDRLGFYRVYAALSNGVMLAAAGPRPAGFLTYAVTPDPHSRPKLAQSESFFGMQGGYGPRIVMPFLGIRWYNGGPGRWRDYESKRAGQFEEAVARMQAEKKGWGSFNPTHSFEIGGKKLEWKGFQTRHMYRPPNWAVRPGSFSYCTGALKPEAEEAWADYCRLYGAQYKDDDEGGPDEKHFYELTWEPNFPWGYKGTPAELVRIYEIGYAALHEADPKAVVTGPTMTGMFGPGSIEEYETLFRLGLGKAMDVFDCHPYVREKPEKWGYIARLRAIRETIGRHVGRELPMIGTESGLLNQPPTVEGWLRHARHNIRENLILLGEGFAMNQTFYLHDAAGSDGPNDHMGYFLWLTEKFAYGAGRLGPKPAAAAYAAMTWLLEGYKGVSVITWMGDTALGYAYQRGGDVTLALWDWSGAPRQVNLPVGADRVRVFDWMGNGRDATCPNGCIGLTLTEEPTYVKGVSATLWGTNAVKPLEVRQMSERVFPGDTVDLEVTVGSPEGNPFQGELRMASNRDLGLSAAARPVAVAAGKTEKEIFRIVTPAALAPGTYPVAFTLAGANGAVAAHGLSVAVREPLIVEKVSPTWVKGEKGVRVRLKEERGVPVAGTISARLVGVPETEVRQAFELAAGERQDFSVVFPDLDVPALQSYPLELGLQTDAGYTAAARTRLGFLLAPRVRDSTDPADETVWATVQGVRIAGPKFLIDGKDNYGGDDDVRADVRYAWNEQGLLVRCDVGDDAFRQGSDVNMAWVEDSIQLAFNLDPEKAEQEKSTEAVGLMRASELVIAKTRKGDAASRCGAAEIRYLPLGPVPAADLRLNVRVETGRILYTMCIPWKVLGASQALSLGDSLTTALLINDLDPGEKGMRAQLQMFGGIGDGKYPERYGWLVLGE